MEPYASNQFKRRIFPRVQERLKLTSFSDKIVNHNYKFDGVDTVHVFSVDTMPMNDYKAFRPAALRRALGHRRYQTNHGAVSG